MSKKRMRSVPVQPEADRTAKARGVVWRQSAEEAALAKKPRYNGFACGHGAHGDAKYSRAKAKRAWRKQLRQEGASRGSFPFPALALVAAAAPSTAAEKMGRVCGGSGTRSRLGL